MRPDPYLGSINLANPQSLNRYAYVLNGPTLFTDPMGLSCVTAAGTTTCEGDPKIPPEFIDLLFGTIGSGSDGGGGGGATTSPNSPAANKGKPLTPKQQQCVSNAEQDHNLAVSRARRDANHTWWVVIRTSVGSGAVSGCVAGAIGGEGIGCLPIGVVGAFGGFVFGVPAGLWDAINQLDVALARAEEDFHTALQRCVQ